MQNDVVKPSQVVAVPVDAERLINQIIVKQLTKVQRFPSPTRATSPTSGSTGSRMDFVMYVDDGYVTDACSAAAQAELDELNAAFKIEIKETRFSWATRLWPRTPRRDDGSYNAERLS